MNKFKINAALKRRYAKIAKHWSGERYAGLRRDDVLPEIIKAARLDKIVASEARVLEAMCGTGIVGTAAKKSLEKQNKKCDLFYLDFSKEMLEQIGEPSKKILGDIRRMPFPNNFFDRIFIRHGIHDLDKDSQILAFKEVYRILKPDDGVFVLVAYYGGEQTQYFYNQLVNLKDELAGWSSALKRHFPTKKEYVGLFREAGFLEITDNFNFVGKIAYQKTELAGETGEKWKNFVLNMPPKIKAAMNIKIKKGILEYNFPCAVFTARKEEK